MSQATDYRQQSLATIAALADKAAAGNYIFRGENQDRDQPIKSSLYREYQKTDILDLLDLDTIQDVEVGIARKHGNTVASDQQLLHLLQHHRGKTNLIDFTEDYLIALFFACDGNLEKNGRFILLDKSKHREHITKPTRPRNRVIAQKSIFVAPPNGYIEQGTFEQIVIMKELKRSILDVLRTSHGITGATIYNDLHGYVTRRDLTAQTLQTVAEGIRFQQYGDYQQAIAKYGKAIRDSRDNPTPYLLRAITYYHLSNFEQAIADNSEAIALNPFLKEAYNNRGVAYEEMDNPDAALDDYNQTIVIDPYFANAYNNRGLLLLTHYGDRHGAILEFDLAINCNPYLAIAYCNRGLARIPIDGTLPATEDFDIAIGLDPKLGIARFIRGDLRRQMGHQEAYDDLAEAHRLDHTLPKPPPHEGRLV